MGAANSFDRQGLNEQLDALDPALLGTIDTETTIDDRRSLLALHLACRRAGRPFRWLEIGSHLGGGLQALIRDPACVTIDSIDPRPLQVPDERLKARSYPDNSTARMRQLLGSLSGADLEKLRTHDAATAELDPTSFEQPDVCFVDGEHTDEACAGDAEFCREVLQHSGVIVFHDVWIVYRAIASFIGKLDVDGVPYRLAYLPDSIFVVELREGKLLGDPAVTQRQLASATGVLWMLHRTHHYRAVLGGRRARVLRRLRLIPT